MPQPKSKPIYKWEYFLPYSDDSIKVLERELSSLIQTYGIVNILLAMSRHMRFFSLHSTRFYQLAKRTIRAIKK